MAHGRALELREIQPGIVNSWSVEEWSKKKENVPGDPSMRPKGRAAIPRKIRRKEYRNALKANKSNPDISPSFTSEDKYYDPKTEFVVTKGPGFGVWVKGTDWMK